MAAALGLQTLPVRRRVRVAIFSTGDEIVEPGAPLPAAGLYDANRELLRGLLTQLGADVSDLGILRDDPDTLGARLTEAASRQDLVLTSGGVSTGEADYVREAIEQIGKLVFWRVAIKPGRPVAMGVLRGTAFVGLPGNPVAVFVTFARVVRPLLLRLAGANPEPLVALPVASGFAYRKKRAAGICPRVAHAACRRHVRGAQASAGWRGRDLLSHRDRRPCRVGRRRDRDRAGPDHRLPAVLVLAG